MNQSDSASKCAITVRYIFVYIWLNQVKYLYEKIRYKNHLNLLGVR